ncbi:MAG: glycine cleavage system protein H [Thermoprotei archaeon]|nr:MAG: glycine cleavage system protein H [Thermoprotei archaeon]RLF13234.1 MAG: glycine cleavage system protein H [Thermoprotei archaeon]
MSSAYREGLYYERSHAWLKVEGELVRVGVDDVAQRAVGRVIYVGSLTPGSRARRGRPLITLESRKWVGYVNSPVTGIVVEFNHELRRRPSLINEDPYGLGWVVLLKPDDLASDLTYLLTGEEARRWLEEEESRLVRRVA